MTNPLVTIITPTFNQGQFIEATIRSVLGQTYRNIEYIVIDAMSTDQTAEIVERYQDSISITIREPDRGQSDAIVKGFKMAKGELVGWVNSDDILYPDCIARIVAAYRKQPKAVLFHNSEIDTIDSTGTLIERVTVPLIAREHLLREDNELIQPGSFYSRAALSKVDYFDLGLRYSMDLDLWLRLLSVGSAVDIGTPPVASYRKWDGTKTSTGGVMLARDRIALLRHHGALPSDKAIKDLKMKILKWTLRDLPVIGEIYQCIYRLTKSMRS